MKISDALSWSSIYSLDLGRPQHSQRSTCLGNTRQNDIDIRWSKYIHTDESRVLQLNYTPVRCTYLLPHTIHHRRHGWHSTYLCLIEKKIFFSVPVILTVIKNVLSRPPPSSTPTPPTTPTTSATRVPDPLEDFATFVSFCSKVYADQGKSDLYEAEWFTLIGPDLCAIRVTFGHRKNLC